ncbi:hypothetical protein KY366_06610 [Candidatus Woesearchaeota archaeon]|nr:hypothetical protein [Candidatus Woesearchaeota archaeon]
MEIKGTKVIWALLLLVAAAALISVTAMANPYGPTIYTNGTTERADFSSVGAKGVAAQAGNVTEITINTSIVTQRWQGYFGNISGTITLDDASGNTMYDWAAGSGFSPTGEIYAANQTVSDWDDVICVNFTGNGTPGNDGINVTVLETMYGMSSDDSDGVDETFSSTDDIIIGTRTLSDCPATYIYQSDSQVSGTWNETLLTENSTGAVIFAAEVEQDTIGFDGKPWDFQMIVGDNDGYSSGTTTTYWFYVELV